MTSRSTASSSTELADRRESPAEQPRDPSRRQFFRAFGRQTVSGAGKVIRAADQLRRGSASAASELLGLGVRDPVTSAARLERRVLEEASEVEARDLESQGITPETENQGFRSPYLFRGDSLLLLDQREPMESGATVECRAASEVAAAITAGVAGGGPVLAQVAAYGLLLASVGSVERPRPARRAAFQAAANTLRMARPAARSVGWAVERMNGRWEQAIDLQAAEALGQLRTEADQIALQSATDNARLGQHGAGELARLAEGPLTLLAHGDMGPLAGGLVGTGFAVVQSALSAGREVHVWLTEAAPGLEGRRLAAPQLAQAEVEHTVIPDSAVGWLFAERRLDALLLRPDLVCANGDSAALLGSLSAARLAAAAGVPVYACAPTLVVEPALAEGDAIPRSRGEPELDVLPAELIDAFVTEAGVLRAPYAASLSAALAPRSDTARPEAG